MINFSDTICAPATTPGSGAITVIRISGPDAFSIADKVVTLASGTVSETKGGSIKHGTVHYPDGSVLDEVLASVFKAPRSYTGEDSVEISCHASRFVAEELTALLCDAGARPASPGEFTRRSFVNGKMDLAQAEAVADVISSTDSVSLRIAINQLKGGYSHELADMRNQLLQMASLLELELDFSEEDVEFANRDQLKGMLDDICTHIRKLTESFRYGNAIRNGVPAAIVGAANAGKSTLLNALLNDDRAIVSDMAGTTRDTVEETLMIEGRLFRIIDTAGIRDASNEIERIGIDRSYKKLQEASIVLAMLDMSVPIEDNLASISDIVSKMDFSWQKLFVLFNKIDLSSSDPRAGLMHNNLVSILNDNVLISKNKVIMLQISAKSREGIDLLKKELAESQKGDVDASEQTIVTNMRHYKSLKEALSSLEKLSSSLRKGITADLLSEDLRQALSHLGAITGEITPDEILGEIFSRFCIGK